jgi:aryl-alcohol dehydrogenase-like predicted oxidoreductase
VNEGIVASLKRLQVDYVDLLFCHRPDPLTPTETVVRAMTDVVRSGKATAWGTSEWSAQQITEAVWIAKTHGNVCFTFLPKVEYVQILYLV